MVWLIHEYETVSLNYTFQSAKGSQIQQAASVLRCKYNPNYMVWLIDENETVSLDYTFLSAKGLHFACANV